MSLSDPEVLATFMKPRPELPMYWSTGWPEHPWWVLCKTNGGGMAWNARTITLNECHEVEAKLTDKQWKDYCWRFQRGLPCVAWKVERDLLHASAEQKVKALAAVLRPVVEGKRP